MGFLHQQGWNRHGDGDERGWDGDGFCLGAHMQLQIQHFVSTGMVRCMTSLSLALHLAQHPVLLSTSQKENQQDFCTGIVWG